MLFGHVMSEKGICNDNRKAAGDDAWDDPSFLTNYTNLATA